MTLYGYARVSSTDQNLDLQVERLRQAGCSTVRSEKASGTSRQERKELEILLDFIQEGDTLMVTRIDRLARSMKDLLDITETLRSKGVTLKATEQSFDTGDIYGDMTMKLLGVFAEFETNLRKERQMEGIAKAKERGVYKGRKRSVDREAVVKLQAKGLGATAIAKELGIGRASVYRVLANAIS